MLVIIGGHRLYFYTGIKASSQIRVGVSRIFSHPDYDRSTLDADYAIVELARDVPFMDYIQPICLPMLREPLKGILTKNEP